MSSERIVFVTDKYVTELEKGDMVRLPFQVIQKLDLKKGDKIELQPNNVAEGEKTINGFTVIKYQR